LKVPGPGSVRSLRSLRRHQHPPVRYGLDDLATVERAANKLLELRFRTDIHFGIAEFSIGDERMHGSQMYYPATLSIVLEDKVGYENPVYSDKPMTCPSCEDPGLRGECAGCGRIGDGT